MLTDTAVLFDFVSFHIETTLQPRALNGLVAMDKRCWYKRWKAWILMDNNDR